MVMVLWMLLQISKKAWTLTETTINTISNVATKVSPGIQTGLTTYNNAMISNTNKIHKKIAEEKLKQEKIKSTAIQQNLEKIIKCYQIESNH